MSKTPKKRAPKTRPPKKQRQKKFEGASLDAVRGIVDDPGLQARARQLLDKAGIF